MTNLIPDERYVVTGNRHGHRFKIGEVVTFTGGRHGDEFQGDDGAIWYLDASEVAPAATKQAERDYVVGLPVCVTVHDGGRVTIDVDLAEIGDVLDNVEGVITDQHEADVSTMSAAAARLGNCLTFTINPAREA